MSWLYLFEQAWKSTKLSFLPAFARGIPIGFEDRLEKSKIDQRNNVLDLVRTDLFNFSYFIL